MLTVTCNNEKLNLLGYKLISLVASSYSVSVANKMIKITWKTMATIENFIFFSDVVLLEVLLNDFVGYQQHTTEA